MMIKQATPEQVVAFMTNTMKSTPEQIITMLQAEIERLTNAIRRIDGINDNPADYNPAINAICDAILREPNALEPKPC
jgi:hypothetical protein